MKRFFTALFILLGVTTSAVAANGYKIQIRFTDVKDTMVYLAHYYAKALPTIYKSDSARVDKKGIAIIESKEETLGGIYMIMLDDKKTYFEFLLTNGDNMSITATTATLPLGVSFKNSPENERFQEYSAFLKRYGHAQDSLVGVLRKAKTHEDSAAVFSEGNRQVKEFKQYRIDYPAKYPNTLLANIFLSLVLPEIPQGKHYLPDGTLDSQFSYNYYKDHYWDKFVFADGRIINTPIYDAKLDEYFNKLVLPWPDSVQKEGDALLAKARANKDIFKYTLHWLTQFGQTSKVMGMDQAFVHFVENYHMKGDAFWMDKETLDKYIERARKIAPNVIGNLAPQISMVDVNKGVHNLRDVKSKYTLIVFWSPNCGHCQEEIPRLDSLYTKVLKNKGVTIYSVRTEGEVDAWQGFIKKHGLEDWINVYDPDHHSNYRADYDIYGTPIMYLLDEKKIIRGKRLDVTNIEKLVEILETKEKAEKNSKG